MIDNEEFLKDVNKIRAAFRISQPDLLEAYQQLEAKMVNIYKLSGLTLDDIVCHLMKGDVFAPPDLFKHQQAEIDRLRNILLCFMNEVSAWENKHGLDVSELPLIPIRDESAKIIEQIKAEAIKQFAERLKKNMAGAKILIGERYIDNLVKEMVGEG